MAELYRVDSPISRVQRNNLNNTFKDIQKQIGKTTINIGKVKDEIESVENIVDNKVGNIQSQVNELVVSGDSSVEAAQARVGYDGEVYPTLKTRIDSEIIKTEEQLFKKAVKDKIYKKTVLHEFPFKFPDYDSALGIDGATYMFPQGLAVDELTKEVFVAYWNSGVIGNWVAVFDKVSGNYKSCFRIGPNTGTSVVNGEGLVIKYEGNERFIYSKVSDLSISKFNITTLPSNLSILTPVSIQNLGVRQHFTFGDSSWFVQQTGTASENNKGLLYYIYDDEFNKKGSFLLDNSVGGYRSGSLSDLGVKTQGITFTPDSLIQLEGGYTDENTQVTAYNYQGVKMIDFDGALIKDGTYDPKKSIEILRDAGYDVDFVEYEAISSTEEGIYSIILTRNTDSVGGVLLLEEFSEKEEALDFSPAKSRYKKIYKPLISSDYLFPVGRDGKLTHPLTGANLETFEQILDFMNQTSIRKIAFHTQYATGLTSSITNMSDVYVNSLYEIVAIDLTRFFIKIRKQNAETLQYSVTGNSGSRTATRMYDPLERTISNNWQKFKLTQDNGVSIYPGDDITSLASLTPGQYYITGAKSQTLTDAPVSGSFPGYVNVQRADGDNKIISYRSSNTGTWRATEFTAVVTGGTISQWFKVNKDINGTTNPEGSVIATEGTFYTMTTAPVRLFFKASGNGNTGWKEVTLT